MKTGCLNPKFSSQSRIIYSLIIVFCIAVVIIFYLMYEVFDKKLSNDLYSRATEVIDVIDYMAQTSGESPELVKGIKTLAANQDIKLIIIKIDDPSLVIASNKHALIGNKTNKIFSDDLGAESFNFNSATNQYVATTKILLENRLRNGHFVKASVGVVFDTTKKYSLLREQALSTSLALILTMIFVLSIVYYLTKKYIFKPLEVINKTLILNNSEKEFLPIPIANEDEIGSVATTLNQLFTDIYESKKTLRENTERYDLALQGTHVGLIDWNIETNTLFFSSSLLKILGVDDEDFSPDMDWFDSRAHEEDREIARASLIAHLKFDTKYDVEGRLRHNNGEYIWMRGRGQAVRDSNGKAIRMVGYYVDISKRKAHEHFINSIYMLSSDATTPLDLKLNRMIIETCGYLNMDSGIISKIDGDIYTTLHCHAPDHYEIDPSCALNLKDTLCEYTIKKNGIFAISDLSKSDFNKHRSHTMFGLNSYIAFPIYVHGGIYGTINFFDKKIRKQPFEEREKSFIRLVSQWIGNELMRSQYIDYLHETENRLEDAVTELTHTNAELENFVYVASHDLQEPLRMITNFTNLLERNYSDKLDATAKEYLNITSDSALQMRKLIKSLLEYARVSKGDEKTEYVDLNEVISHVFANLEKQIQESCAEFEVKRLPTIIANKASMVSLLQNLVSNGIKFQSKNEIPKIEISTKQYAKSWELSVKDNGIGIQSKYASKIFEPFKRLHVKNEYPGTGIGLAVCKKITDRMGSSIRVESNEGVGSTFYVSIPNQFIEAGKAA